MTKYTIGYEVLDGKVSAIRVDIHTGRVVDAAEDVDVVGVGVAGDGSADPVLPDGMPVARLRREYAAVAGAGVASPSTMVIDPAAGVFLMNSRVSADVPGVTRVDGFLPGYVGYDVRLPPAGEGLPAIETAALALANQCDALRAAGVPVRRFVAVGPARLDPQVMQTFADVLAEKIAVAASDEPVLLGAAIHGCLAAEPAVTGYAAVSTVVKAMARQREDLVYRPDIDARRAYAKRRTKA